MYLETGHASGFRGQAQAGLQGDIDDGFQALPCAPYLALQPFGNFRVECQGRAHEDIMMSYCFDVKMSDLDRPYSRRSRASGAAAAARLAGQYDASETTTSTSPTTEA